MTDPTEETKSIVLMLPPIVVTPAECVSASSETDRDRLGLYLCNSGTVRLVNLTRCGR